MNMTKHIVHCVLLIGLILLVTGCEQPEVAEIPIAETTIPPTETLVPPTLTHTLPPTFTWTPAPTDTPTITPTMTSTPVDYINNPPVERQRIEITTSDGREITAYYYPPATTPAPVVIMLHSAYVDMEVWRMVAPWLQNRGNHEHREVLHTCDGEIKNPGVTEGKVLLKSWFPELPPETPFGVLIFNFYECGHGDSQMMQDTDMAWEDITAVMQAVSQIEGVDPYQISTIGVSLGGKFAARGCYKFNQLVESGQATGWCKGVFAISPGEIEGRKLYEIVADLEALDPPVPVYCLTSEVDGFTDGELACTRGSGEHYKSFLYKDNSGHGFSLFVKDMYPYKPAAEKNVLQIYLDFLEEIYEIELVE